MDRSLFRERLIPKRNWLGDKCFDKIRLCEYIIVQYQGLVRLFFDQEIIFLFDINPSVDQSIT